MEYMNASIDRFYQQLHTLDSLTDTQFDRFLCRLTHDVSCCPKDSNDRHCFIQITSALQFLRTLRILHRDVKPQNMLVNRQAVFKLCDFGISRRMRTSQSVVQGSVQGTEAYLPVMIDSVERSITFFVAFGFLSQN
jgi:serine/threonine protein kinase